MWLFIFQPAAELLGLQFPILGRNRRNNHFWKRIKPARFLFFRGQFIQWFPKQKWSPSSCSLSHEKKRGKGAHGELRAVCVSACWFTLPLRRIWLRRRTVRRHSPRWCLAWWYAGKVSSACFHSRTSPSPEDLKVKYGMLNGAYNSFQSSIDINISFWWRELYR